MSRIQRWAIGEPPLAERNGSSQQPTPDCRLSSIQPSRNGTHKTRTSPQISPPPLKRRRTSLDNGSPATTKRPEPLYKSFPTLARLTAFSDNGPDLRTLSSSPRFSDNSSTLFNLSTSTKAAASHMNITKRSDNGTTTAGDIARSNPSNGSDLARPTCRSCKRRILDKGFNPLIVCPSCKRSYHDACRRPPLAPGADAKNWRCMRCIGKTAMPVHLQRDAIHQKQMPFPLLDSVQRRSPQIEEPPRATTGVVTRELALQHTKTFQPTLELNATRTDACDHTSPEPTVRIAQVDTDDELEKMLAEVVQPKKTPLDKTEGRGRCSEIPDTPDQCPGQVQMNGPLATFSGPGTTASADAQLDDDDTTFVEDLEPIPKSNITRLCEVCKTQPVLAKYNIMSIRCVRCKGKSVNPALTQTTIPETPGSKSFYSSGIRVSTQISASAVLLEETSLSPTTPFPAGLPRSKSSRIVTKKVHTLGPAAVSKNQRRKSPPSQERPAAWPEPINTITRPPEDLDAPLHQEEQREHLPTSQSQPEESPISADRQPQPELRTSNENLLDEASKDTLAIISDGVLSIPLNSAPRQQSPACIEPDASAGAENATSDPNRSIVKAAKVEHGKKATNNGPTSQQAEPSIVSGDANSHKRSENAAEWDMIPSQGHPKKVKYSNKQLAGMALVAAGGPLPAADILNWIGDNSNDRQKGKGGWEMSTRAVLSGAAEFSTLKRAGSKTFYDFSDVSFQKHVENMFSDHFLVEIPNRRTEAMRTSPAGKSTTGKKLVNTIQQGAHLPVSNDTEVQLEILGEKESLSYRDHCSSEGMTSISMAKDISTNASVCSRDIDGILMPFERANCFDHNDQSITPHVIRESSFSKAFPELTKPSVETMSKSDIEKKIMEIKNRPSRKARWGDRLAFARLHREDVHDERDGAWKPRFPSQARDQEDAGTPGAQKASSLRELFAFPANPIPMIYNEQLAFRDGTLVNGKLPRPRVIYKVGR